MRHPSLRLASLLFVLLLCAPIAFAESAEAPAPEGQPSPTIKLESPLFCPAPVAQVFPPGNFCFDACSPNGAQAYCKGYACRDGALRKDECSCVQGHWSCPWAC